MKYDPDKVSFGLPYEYVHPTDGEFYRLDVYYDGKPLHTIEDPISTEDLADWAESQKDNIGAWHDHFAAQLGLER